MEGNINKLCQILHCDIFSNHPQIRNIAAKLKIKPQFIILIFFLLVSSVILFTNIGNDLLFLVFGLLFPIYKSYKAIKYKKLDEDKKWLIYWITYGLLSYLKPILVYLLYFLPYFKLFHLALLVLVYLDYSNGYLHIYNKLLLIYDSFNLDILEFKIKNNFINIKNN